MSLRAHLFVKVAKQVVR